MSHLLVAVGGSTGAALRHRVGDVAGFDPTRGFPWSTLGVNLAGCLLLGAVLGRVNRLPRWTIPVVAVGLCGALTTFSGFAFETVELARADRWATAAAYVALTVPGAVGALLAGRAATRPVEQVP